MASRTTPPPKHFYDNLDFMRGVDAFLNAMPGASVEALRVGMASQGADNNQTILIFENLMDSHSLFLTGNTESIYNLMWLDTKAGPLVIETPPNVLGVMHNHYLQAIGRARRYRLARFGALKTLPRPAGGYRCVA